ncbi:Ras-like protein 2 [Tritrichomonas foetus]|uniref:small monomeric GTPase n=1 Tax=Tritrichomonas foetus TaxID=1144522 RepID=A0A1J4JQS3_9EUKA|nr:Ras-like protein 2 [Tritrichomonas foetus]|eukprot:OHS99869.1 Ras-like protein 2 [Tritrichomonas foetus]
METYKVIVLGSGGVGKSALTIQLVQCRFVASYDPTIEDSYKKMINVDDKDVSLDILDTAGQDDFAAIRATYMRSGQGFIVVFAVNDPTSWDQVDKFQSDIKVTSGKDDIPIVVCGNKCDIEDREVKEDEARQYCREKGLTYFETSAKNNYNVHEAFVEVTRMMRKQNPAVQKETQGGGDKPKKSSDDSNNKSEGGGGCCNIA